MPIDFELSKPQQDLKILGRELARDFATRGLAHDQDRSLPVENFAALRAAGIYGIALPAELGGLGTGTLGWVVFAEELAQGDASTALAFNMHVNATGGIAQRPTIPRTLKERVAKIAVEEGRLICTSVSEPASSSLLPAATIPSVRAHAEPGGYRLYGKKFFASMFEASDYAYLYAHPDHDPNPAAAIALLVPTRQDGITVQDVWDTLGMRATRSNQVTYDGAFVPHDLVLYQTDNFIDAFVVQEANWAFGGYTACYLGIGLGIVDWVANQLRTRKAKGFRQVMGYAPANSHRVGEMVTEMEAARLMVYRAAWQTDTQGPSLDNFSTWLRAKLAVGMAVQRVANHAVIACGVHALFRSAGLELKLRDATTAPIMPPSSDGAASMVGLLAMGLDPAAAPAPALET